MSNIEKKQEPFKGEKWLYYQDVKPTNISVKPTERTKKDVEEFRNFIDKKIKKEKDAQKK